MVVFAHEMKQELLNIMINRFTFVINNECGLNTEPQENAWGLLFVQELTQRIDVRFEMKLH